MSGAPCTQSVRLVHAARRVIASYPRPRKQQQRRVHDLDMPTRMSNRRRALEWESMRRTGARLLLSRDGDLLWRETLTSNTRNAYDIEIAYPPSFPFERPLARILAPDVDEFAPHRYMGGGLCLFPTSFDPTLACTAGVIRNRAALWIFYYEEWQQTGVWHGPELDH